MLDTTTTTTSSTAEMLSNYNQSIESESSDSPLCQDQLFNPRQCLFCNFELDSLDANLSHMSHAHSFSIPNASHLIDTDSFLAYLSQIISEFHECLFCASVRSSKVGVQDHMRDKGHCRLDSEGYEDEFEGFYDFSEDEGEFEEEGESSEEMVVVSPDEDELRLPSGKILAHRSSRPHHSRQRLSTRSQSQPPPQTSSPTSSHSPPSQELSMHLNNYSNTPPRSSNERRVVARPGTSTSMIGIPELQQRALRATEKKMELVQTKARNQYEARVERGGNRQKRFKVCSIGKKAGGLEKRLG